MALEPPPKLRFGLQRPNGSTDNMDVIKIESTTEKTDNWTEALKKLSKEDQAQFDFAKSLEQDPIQLLQDVFSATQQKKEECMEKRWKAVVMGKSIILRDVLEKISLWIKR